jgi:hypothetical protein
VGAGLGAAAVGGLGTSLRGGLHATNLDIIMNRYHAQAAAAALFVCHQKASFTTT